MGSYFGIITNASVLIEEVSSVLINRFNHSYTSRKIVTMELKTKLSNKAVKVFLVME